MCRVNPGKPMRQQLGTAHTEQQPTRGHEEPVNPREQCHHHCHGKHRQPSVAKTLPDCRARCPQRLTLDQLPPRHHRRRRQNYDSIDKSTGADRDNHEPQALPRRKCELLGGLR